MGLFQDQTSSLSEIKRLAALVTDPSRREEIGSDQWPLAMIAYGLVTCNETGREEEGVTIYNMFQSRCAPDARRKCALQLAAFIRQRKGDGWRALYKRQFIRWPRPSRRSGFPELPDWRMSSAPLPVPDRRPWLRRWTP